MNFKKWGVADGDVLWGDAELLLGINDLQGIHENPKIISNGQALVSESSANVGFKSTEMSGTGIIVPFRLEGQGRCFEKCRYRLGAEGK
ncbi:MAG: hypothetical protein WDO15_00130 [Bacteroidota bacterium]